MKATCDTLVFKQADSRMRSNGSTLITSLLQVVVVQRLGTRLNNLSFANVNKHDCNKLDFNRLIAT